MVINHGVVEKSQDVRLTEERTRANINDLYTWAELHMF